MTTIEIVGTWVREKFRFSNDKGDVVIGVVDCGGDLDIDLTSDVTVKGPADVDELSVGGTYRFLGQWTEYLNKRTGQRERQFAFQTFVASEPHTEDAVVGYLCQCDGIGPSTAKTIFKRFGQNAVRMLREQPGAVAEAVKRLRPDVAEQASKFLQERADIEQTTMDVMELLRGRYFPSATARNAIKRWGNKAAQLIRRNPFRLMELPGCGFLRCDAMWVSIGLPPTRLKRQALCAWWYCRSDSSGNTWHSVQMVRRAVITSIGSTAVNPDRAIRLALRAGLLWATWTDGVYGGLEDDGDQMWLADASKAASEESIARSVEFMMSMEG